MEINVNYSVNNSLVYHRLCCAANALFYTVYIKYCLHNNCGCVVQVCDTHELSTSLRTSLVKVISWKFVSRSRCYSTKVRRVGPGVRLFYLPVFCLYILNIKL